MDSTPETWVAFAVSSNCAAARFCKVQNTRSTTDYYYKESAGACVLVDGTAITAATEDATSDTVEKCKTACDTTNKATCTAFHFATDTKKCFWYTDKDKPKKGDGKTANTTCYAKDFKYDAASFKTNVLK